MALNKYMHPRNPYRTPPDFKLLAVENEEFRKFARQDLSGKVKLNFKEEGAVRALTRALLLKDFQLDVDIPPNRLVPTLPLRLNYLLWLEDLMQLLNSEEPVHGIDIGTGASCVYPLVAAKKFGWSMLATEVNSECVKYAEDNVRKNNLEHLITVKQVEGGNLVKDLVTEDTTYHFTMCNPPFFKDESELDSVGKGRTEHRSEPKAAQTGSKDELVTSGGEVAFVSQLVQESKLLRSQIKIYTTMVGQKSSLTLLKQSVRDIKPCSMATTEFCQGRTTRWGLAWTFVPQVDLSKACKMGVHAQDKEKPPFRHCLSLPPDTTLLDVRDSIVRMLTGLEMEIECIEENEAVAVSMIAERNTWTGARKKKREERRKQLEAEQSADPDSTGSLKRPMPDSSTDPKKLKTDPEDSTPGFHLVALLILHPAEDQVIMELNYLEGNGGREAANQVLLYIKNRLFK